ncbi:YgaP family membrane protein [Marinicella gelatinilytica]|uniref:YgaP family membrane protein n=1 Tax=Marinicella gelatinilytica TaxID=2996017 RepID=UPI002260D3C6|nr:DUF2892 domain-containing protein [Marinicella gelatinilytica]MCX7544015.1 DUF2892 domain-containing protein [Marinicella gelatinilytica]
MNINRWIQRLAGLFVLVSLLLAHITGDVNLLKPTWLWIAVFVGFNLFQSSFTGFCPLAKILKAAGVKE